MPMRMAVRDGPAQRTARMKTIWESPGTKKPISNERPQLRGRVDLRRETGRRQRGDEERRRRDHDAAEHRVAAAEEAGPHGDGHRAEERAREEPEEDGVHPVL